ncbi:MAG: hypothetical protein SOU05_00065 [Atopobium sp.]|uniref:hypothetical protein n=1 Tax=Atopobium sp. TaxID=1872650 RepID=UPI002A763561|nr:hypothetical protein [Atopobium sp.]MDY2787794.1 hypothetical protein [Atopobium sp.]
MEKKYIYEAPFYFIEVVLVGIVCSVVTVVCLALAVFHPILSPGLLVFIAFVAFYQVWNTFISISNPEVVTLSDSEISFAGFNRVHIYKIDELSVFLVRPFPSSGKTYIRINNHNLFRGRYWVPTKMFSDGKELFNQINDLDYKINPNSLKSRARRVNSEYIENKKRKK